MTTGQRKINIQQKNKYSYHYRMLLSLGIPIVVGQVGTIILGFADTLMVGHHSVMELAAASFVNTIMAIILVLALGFSYGLTPMVGQLFGRGEREKIGSVMKNGLAAGTLTPIILLGVLTAVYLNVDKLGQPVELLPLVRPYLLVNMISVPFVCWFNSFKQFYDAIGNTKMSMYILLAGNVANIVGNYLLIYGPGPLPELGLLGAGLSTMLSRVMMFVVAFAIFMISKRYKVYSRSFRDARLSGEAFRQVNKQSWPVSLQMGMESAAFSLTGVLVGWLGTTALAAHQVMITVSQVFFMIYYGIAAAVSVRVSFYVGQNDITELRRVTAAGFHIICMIGCVVSIPVFLLRHETGFIFANDATIAEICAHVTLIMIVYQFGDGMQCCYANALRGTGHVQPMVYIAFVAFVLVSLPCSWLLGIHMGYGIMGIWGAFPVGLTVAGVLYYIFFRRQVARLEHGGQGILAA